MVPSNIIRLTTNNYFLKLLCPQLLNSTSLKNFSRGGGQVSRDNSNNDDIDSGGGGEKESSSAVVVYTGPMNLQILRTKQLSLFSSVLILAAQPILWDKFANLDSVILQSAMGGGLSFFLFGTPILIHSFTRKYVMEMTLDSETKTFEATTISLFLRRKKLRFTQSDIVVPTTPLPFTSIYAKETPLLFLGMGWKSRFAYDHLMCLDKPIDWSHVKKGLGKGTQSTTS